jgi:hypothetical protein
VIHSGPHALYVRFGDRVVGIAARGAVRVPAAVATALPALPDVPVGASAEIRDGALYVAGLAVTVERLLPTTAPRIDDPAVAFRRLSAVLPDLTPVRRQLPTVALDALALGDPTAVPLLVGRGDGLTPVGDDVISGWMVTAHAAGRPLDAIHDAVRYQSHRTTTLSATLLADAAEGDCIPEFRALLLALVSGRDLGSAVTGLVAVGHTSGAGMLLGAHLALSDEVRRSPTRAGAVRRGPTKSDEARRIPTKSDAAPTHSDEQD